jgi:hypothetical protein
MHATCEEARTIIDHVEAAYFQGTTANDEAMLAIRTDYVKIGTMLRAALDLLHDAEEWNQKWQSRPEEQMKKEVEA